MAPPPHDIDAENALIGDMLALPDIVADAGKTIIADDFWQPAAAAAFAAIVAEHQRGETVDTVGLAAMLREAGLDPDPHWLVAVVSSGSGSWRKHADIIVRHRIRRDIIALVADARDGVSELGVDPADVLDQLRSRLGAIHVPDGKPPADVWLLDEFMDRPDHEAAPWIVPGLLRRGWRVVVVGYEGQGKSTLWRQFAMLAASGIHPLGFERGPKARTLLVDLENPADAITDSCKPVRAQLRHRNIYEPGRAWIWHRPAGIDLRTRAGRSELAAVCAATNPELVCLGPLYKAYQRGKDSDEEAAAEVQAVLDDLRTRYGFALLLEHHAPQDVQGYRKLRPFGSSLWLRWPEIGIAMEPQKDDARMMELKRWRGDRMRSLWPRRIQRTETPWPWTGVWDDDSWRTT